MNTEKEFEPWGYYALGLAGWAIAFVSPFMAQGDARESNEGASGAQYIATTRHLVPQVVPGPLRYEGRVEPGPMGHSALGPSSTFGEAIP
jgi:hypothetical protein